MDNITYERGILQRSGMVSALIENDNIYQVSGWNAQKLLIGVSINKYNELKEIADGYYNVLVEKGIIEKPKTPEEIAQEQQKLMNEMFNQMKYMQEEIKNLKQQPIIEEQVIEKNPIINNIEETKENIISENKNSKEEKKEKKLLNFK